ncbi:glycosyltransferase [uncultured Algibacter sp.]|uniref:glycosyltransferase n=1 Tax=uncultured Algibacter sp. TaxID=298659 RepID=UPI00261FAFA5|nr:glycosyltransferase [uncultured Algibacter sp.]
MKVYHILEDYSKRSGGVRTVVNDLIHHLPFDKEVITTKKDLEDNFDYLKSFNSDNGWKFSKPFKNHLKTISSNRDSIYHIHGAWMYPQYIAAKTAIKNKIAFVLTIHGMYEPWLWQEGYIKKKVYFEFLVKNNFSKANVLHAITNDEANQFKKIFKNKTRIEVIPNLISFKEFKPINEINTDDDEYILFLGRIDPKKGIKMLIEVYSKIKGKKPKLKIAGPDNIYKLELIELTSKLDTQKEIEFLGFVQGEEKLNLLKNAKALITPSFSEVIGMVNLEAAIAKTPVLTTYSTGLLPKWNQEGGLLINPVREELEKALINVFAWSKKERDSRGEALYKFTFENYSWEKNKNKWVELYNNLNH